MSVQSIQHILIEGVVIDRFFGEKIMKEKSNP